MIVSLIKFLDITSVYLLIKIRTINANSFHFHAHFLPVFVKVFWWPLFDFFSLHCRPFFFIDSKDWSEIVHWRGQAKGVTTGLITENFMHAVWKQFCALFTRFYNRSVGMLLRKFLWRNKNSSFGDGEHSSQLVLQENASFVWVYPESVSR